MLGPSPIYLVPGSDMSLHDDGSPFLLLRSIVQLQLLSALINHGLQVNCERKHAQALCRGTDRQTKHNTHTSLLDGGTEAGLFAIRLECTAPSVAPDQYPAPPGGQIRQ